MPAGRRSKSRCELPAPMPGYFNIGLLAYSLGRSRRPRAVCACSLSELTAKGYDYWALGHVHRRESVNGSSHPRVEYPGNLQGRHIRETGAKGCLLVSDRQRRSEPSGLSTTGRLSMGALLRSGRQRNEFDGSKSLMRSRPAFRIFWARRQGQALGVRVELTGATSLDEVLKPRAGD